MNRYEFLEQLEDQLTGRVSAQELMESLSYYKNYIETEVERGRTETEILEELGSPYSIAKSIIDASGANPDFETIYDPEETVKAESVRPKGHVFRADGWKAAAIIIGIVVVILLMLIFAFHLFVALLPFFIPFALILFVIKMITGRR